VSDPQDEVLSVITRSAWVDVGPYLKSEDPVLRSTAQAVWDYYEKLQSAGDFVYENVAPLWDAFNAARDRR
jgi:hypothetical protein